MSDEIRRLSEALAADPASLAFIPLADALRRGGQRDMALRVAQRGLERHPYLADAHDAAARALADLAQLDRAREEWELTLQLCPGHIGALRGLGFIAFQRGDLDGAEQLLADALRREPHDGNLHGALQRVRQARASAQAARTVPPMGRASFDAVEPLGELLIDGAGLVLAGRLRDAGGADVSDGVAAELSGVRMEAERALGRLQLGAWRMLTVESERATLSLAPAPHDAVTLLAAPPRTPAGLVRRHLQRARQRAMTFFEGGA